MSSETRKKACSHSMVQPSSWASDTSSAVGSRPTKCLKVSSTDSPRFILPAGSGANPMRHASGSAIKTTEALPTDLQLTTLAVVCHRFSEPQQRRFVVVRVKLLAVGNDLIKQRAGRSRSSERGSTQLRGADTQTSMMDVNGGSGGNRLEGSDELLLRCASNLTSAVCGHEGYSRSESSTSRTN